MRRKQEWLGKLKREGKLKQYSLPISLDSDQELDILKIGDSK